MRYYYCTNCGHFHDYGKERKRNVKCLDCGYKDVLELDRNDDRKFIPTRLTDKYKNDATLTLQPFELEVRKKYLRKVETDKLVLYNYTDKCVFDRHWNEITRNARGIIFEKKTGNLVAMPFPKFFNLGEQEETFLENLPNEPYTVTEKMDGSLGIVYFYDNEWKVATRGSFTSDQAVKAKEILKKYDMSRISTEVTLLVEIIYPENKIVVNYGDKEELVILGANNYRNREEVTRKKLKVYSEASGMPLVQEYKFTISEMIDFQKTLTKDEEGFVVKYKSGLRVKIKGEEYMNVHRIISHMTPLVYWKAMELGKIPEKYLEQIPEEFREESDKLVNALRNRYKDCVQKIRKEYETATKLFNEQNEIDNIKKFFGLYMQSSDSNYAKGIFAWLDGNRHKMDKFVMSRIRPKGNKL